MQQTQETKDKIRKNTLRFESSKTGDGCAFYDEMTISIDDTYGEVSFEFGGIHADGIETRYPGFAFSGEMDGGYSSIICSKERALEIYRYNLRMLMYSYGL